MKKLTPILLAAMMAAMSGCSSSAPSEPVVSTGSVSESAETPASEVTPEPTPEPTPDIVYTPGTYNGTVYECPTLQIACDLGDWEYGDAAKLGDMNHLEEEATPEVLLKTMENNKSVMDMYAASTDGTLANVIVQIQDLTLTPSYLYATEQEIGAEVVATMENSLKESGYENASVTGTTEIFAGKEHPVTIIQGTYSGVEIYQKQVLVRSGNYLGMINFTAQEEEPVNAAMTKFYALDN